MEDMPEPAELSEEEYSNALHGKVPWTSKDLESVMAFASTLSGISDDELPPELSELTEALETTPGIAEEQRDPRESIKLMWLYVHYIDQGQAAVFAHHVRLTRADRFIDKHFEELVNLGLIKRVETREGVKSGKLSSSLIEALATLPFTEPAVEGGENVFVFAFGDVVAAAQKIRAGKS